MGQRARKRSDIRTRTGCHKCRLRRVKCPEQKPACAPCLKLGFDCAYDLKLRWHSTPLFEVDTVDIALLPIAHTESWMFLSSFQGDYKSQATSYPLSDSDSDAEAEYSESCLERAVEPRSATNAVAPSRGTMDLQADHPSSWADLDTGFDSLPLLARLRLSADESYLWEYFHDAIAPACVLNPAQNPYQDVILRIAASTGNTSPLFLSIMAISSSQLHILGGKRFYVPSCTYRQKALQSLRAQTRKIGGDVRDQSLEAQVIATVMAMVFLDILSDCSESWVVHSNFARSQICKIRKETKSLDPDLYSLLDFVGGYIVAHEVYAHTAWEAGTSHVSNDPVTLMCDDSNLQTLTGCSTGFFQILSDINTLVAQYAESSKRTYADPQALADLDDRRRALERQLHSFALDHRASDEAGQGSAAEGSESALALNIKRLTGLLHMRARIDHLGPDDSCVSELASRILSLIERVPIRSNIILWPLFMVATLGIGPDCDEQRLFILQRLNSLQRQRQIRYIKKARRIIIGVWKLRDAGDANMRTGWGILKAVTRQERISLL